MSEPTTNVEFAPCTDCKATDMDTYTCPDQKEYCLDCCGCPEHEGESWRD